MRYVVFDISNVLYRTFFAYKGQDIETTTGLAHHTALMSMKKFYNKFNPDKVIMVFDRSSWRKEYTRSEDCISGKPYKGNRRQKMTPKEKQKFEQFMEHVQEFENIMRDHTSVVCLAADGLEADDLIAGFCEAYGEDDGDDIIIISRDRDLAQLMGDGKDTYFPNIKQHDPFTGKEITLETAIKDLLKEKKNPIPHEHINTDYFLFAKCIRGDVGDNVQGAYPGVKRPRINKAWADEYERVNLMNHTWVNDKGETMIVKELFAEGQLLMNLRAQPDRIRARIFKTILDSMENPGTYSFFHFMKFLGDNDMKDIAKNAEQFAPLLSR